MAVEHGRLSELYGVPRSIGCTAPTHRSEGRPKYTAVTYRYPGRTDSFTAKMFLPYGEIKQYIEVLRELGCTITSVEERIL